MSRQFPNDRTPRNLVEVPAPLNENTRSSFDQQQPSFNNGNNNNSFSNTNNSFGNTNNSFGNNNNSFGNNNNNQTNDFSITPRVGGKKKTIIIKDEKGNEISRITSSSNSRLPESFLPRNGVVTPVNQFQLAPINPFPQVQNTFNPFPQVQNTLNPLVLQPQFLHPPPSTMVTPVPMLMTQPFSANPYMDRGPLITQTIPEEQMTPSARQNRSSAHYKTLEK